jgi:hypothetical protein
MKNHPTSELWKLQQKWEKQRGKGYGKKLSENDGMEEIVINVPLKHILIKGEVFQPRTTLRDERPMETFNKAQVELLKRNLETEGKLDPILALPLGSKVVVIDGHHRWATYRTSKKDTIPVKLFKGDPYQALSASCAENRKAKLQMSSAERMDYAWFMTQISFNHGQNRIYKAEEIVQSTGVSTRSVAKMFGIVKTLFEERRRAPETWLEAQGYMNDDQNKTSGEDKFKQMVAGFEERIRKALPKITNAAKARAFAQAVLGVSPNWNHEIVDVIANSEEAEEWVSKMDEGEEDSDE